MKNNLLIYGLISFTGLLAFTQCSTKTGNESDAQSTVVKAENGGFSSQVAWGEHLVQVSGCNDCHTPKLMTLKGPVDDTSRLLSGHPEGMPAPDVNRAEMEKKGLTVTQTLTAWVGPWGVSYAANITSDATGIGNWQESNFITAIRHGKYKGLDNSRPLMPPMPWVWYSKMTDDELKAIYAYLKSTKPVKNVVPALEPPKLAAR